MSQNYSCRCRNRRSIVNVLGSVQWKRHAPCTKNTRGRLVLGQQRKKKGSYKADLYQGRGSVAGGGTDSTLTLLEKPKFVVDSSYHTVFIDNNNNLI